MIIQKSCITRTLGLLDFQTVFEKMKTFTHTRTDLTMDEFWLLQHFPVYTLGLSGKPEHILDTDTIPVIQTDRGGQVTYHGPGQLIIYTLVNLHHLNLGIRSFVSLIEQAIIDLLADFDLNAYAKEKAPGVYINEKKIASLGLKVRKGYTYHGLSLNINMDLTPFNGINPCGYAGLQMTQLADFNINADFETLQEKMCQHLLDKIGYTTINKTMEF